MVFHTLNNKNVGWFICRIQLVSSLLPLPSTWKKIVVKNGNSSIEQRENYGKKIMPLTSRVNMDSLRINSFEWKTVLEEAWPQFIWWILSMVPIDFKSYRNTPLVGISSAKFLNYNNYKSWSNASSSFFERLIDSIHTFAMYGCYADEITLHNDSENFIFPCLNWSESAT